MCLKGDHSLLLFGLLSSVWYGYAHKKTKKVSEKMLRRVTYCLNGPRPYDIGSTGSRALSKLSDGGVVSTSIAVRLHLDRSTPSPTQRVMQDGFSQVDDFVMHKRSMGRGVANLSRGLQGG